MERVHAVARRPLPEHPKLRATRADLREPAARRALAGVDVLFHLGAALWRDRRGQTPTGEVNIGGTRNVAEARPGHLIMASSAAVYGAWPDNPVPIEETVPARPNAECPYAAHKLAAERVAEATTETTVARIAAVLGPAMDPAVARAAKAYRVAVPAVRGARQALQFLHESDAVEGLLAAAAAGRPGTYNITTEDWLDEDAVADIARSRVVRLPARFALGGAELAYRVRLTPAGRDRAVFLTGPLAMSSRRATEALGWTARRSSAATLRELLSR